MHFFCLTLLTDATTGMLDPLNFNIEPLVENKRTASMRNKWKIKLLFFDNKSKYYKTVNTLYSSHRQLADINLNNTHSFTANPSMNVSDYDNARKPKIYQGRSKYSKTWKIKV